MLGLNSHVFVSNPPLYVNSEEKHDLERGDPSKALEGYYPFDRDQNISVHAIFEIFSFLDAPALMKCSSVSKQFKKLANDDLLWKGIISRGLPNLFPNLKIRVIDKEVWEKYVDREKWGIRFDGKAASNKQIVKELQAFSKLPIEGDAGITLLNLSNMTTPVTFNEFSEIAKSLELDGVKFFADSIRNDIKERIGNEHIDMNRTILLTNSILEESRNKTYYDQKQLVEEDNGCELPETPLILVSTVFAYLMDKERLFPREPYLTYTRCSNVVELLPGYPAAHIIVGNFTSNGFNISYDFSASTDFFGAAAMRKF